MRLFRKSFLIVFVVFVVVPLGFLSRNLLNNAELACLKLRQRYFQWFLRDAFHLSWSTRLGNFSEGSVGFFSQSDPQ